MTYFITFLHILLHIYINYSHNYSYNYNNICNFKLIAVYPHQYTQTGLFYRNAAEGF